MRRSCRTTSGPLPDSYAIPPSLAPFFKQGSGFGLARMPDGARQEAIGRHFALRGELVQPRRRLGAECFSQGLAAVRRWNDEQNREFLDVCGRKVSADVQSF